MANEQNLKPCTPENARERQKKSSAKQKENTEKREYLSWLYLSFLGKKFTIQQENCKRKKTLTGKQLCLEAIKNVVARGDSASVAMLKEIREATEGQKVNVKNASPLNINLTGALLSAAELSDSSEVEICQPEEEAQE